MAFEIEIPSSLEKALVAEAKRRGVDPASIVVDALRRELPQEPRPLRPREMMDLWRRSSVLGTFADRAESPQFAEELRRNAEQR